MTHFKYWISSTLILVCSSVLLAQAEDANSSWLGGLKKTPVVDNFTSDIEGIQEPMLYPEFWQNKIKQAQVNILSLVEIEKQNIQLFNNNTHMTKLSEFPESLNRQQISKKVLNISKAPGSERYFLDGTKLSKSHYDAYNQALNLPSLPETQSIQFGMVVTRTNMRSFPTSDKVFKTSGEINLDRFQETALFPTETVAILHESLNKQWLFVVSYNYSAWVKKKDIAIGDKQSIFNYKSSESFLIVTGDKVHTTFNPHNKKISDIQLDMGTKISLLNNKDIPVSIGGQNTYTSYVINLPTRNEEGRLKFEAALISRNKDVHVGYLPFNRKNILNQSFKFLGERYGWGHSFNARDCTGFVGEVYKSFGILMPRNSGQQAVSSQGQNIHFGKSASINDKLREIKQLEVGDLIYLPGHVAMYLGLQNDKPFIIHDVSGLSYYKKNGEFYKSTLNGVAVTPLLPLQLNQESTYIDRIYNLKKIK